MPLESYGFEYYDYLSGLAEEMEGSGNPTKIEQAKKLEYG